MCKVRPNVFLKYSKSVNAGTKLNESVLFFYFRRKNILLQGTFLNSISYMLSWCHYLPCNILWNLWLNRQSCDNAKFKHWICQIKYRNNIKTTRATTTLMVLWSIVVPTEINKENASNQDKQTTLLQKESCLWFNGPRVSLYYLFNEDTVA